MNTSPEYALVAGASRGIGNAIAAQLLSRSSVKQVYATGRSAQPSVALESLQRQYGERLVPLAMDITDEASIASAIEQVRSYTDRLDWVINTVGLLHDGAELQPERQLSEVNTSNILASFRVNSLGPLLLAKHAAALLPRREPCTFATLSARVGSITDNRLGGWYAYRASKAAQNMLTKTLSIELKRRYRKIRCVALHPGTVATDLSAPFRGNVDEDKLFTTEQAATYLLDVLDGLNDDDNGKFFAWDGQPIDW